jgi:hypothetical protein
MISSRKTRWAGHVARVVEIRLAYKIMVEKPEGGDHSEGLGVDGRIILEWILEKQNRKLWTVFIWLRIEASSGIL